MESTHRAHGRPLISHNSSDVAAKKDRGSRGRTRDLGTSFMCRGVWQQGFLLRSNVPFFDLRTPSQSYHPVPRAPPLCLPIRWNAPRFCSHLLITSSAASGQSATSGVALCSCRTPYLPQMGSERNNPHRERANDQPTPPSNFRQYSRSVFQTHAASTRQLIVPYRSSHTCGSDPSQESWAEAIGTENTKQRSSNLCGQTLSTELIKPPTDVGLYAEHPEVLQLPNFQRTREMNDAYGFHFFSFGLAVPPLNSRTVSSTFLARASSFKLIQGSQESDWKRPLCQLGRPNPHRSFLDLLPPSL
ncbi:hypothetical protein BDM02DRAFT_3022599 [Thelephora ganbajun]|uniref:Uncharacterized protein n=1 Tax=Thelephora ganbajun TaxID=370292 RepID=A0ACB6ZA20_THEGA|nr:hypothetical protein BDM02DRAFT_3022599 [Thelephora ganbajun]